MEFRAKYPSEVIRCVDERTGLLSQPQTAADTQGTVIASNAGEISLCINLAAPLFLVVL
jgi:hypothetical protein